MAYKSGNPALNKNTFNNLASVMPNEAMTLNGVALKSLLFMIVCVGSGAFGWRLAAEQAANAIPLLYVALLSAFAIGLVTVFKKTWSPFTAPIYVLLEGFVLGFISQIYELEFEGIVLQALVLTGGIFVSMLLLYLFRVIRATENFKLGLAAATGGIAMYYLYGLISSFFGRTVPLISSSSGYGIAFTVAVIIIAALNLVVDFDFIEQGVAQRAPKYMEWYASFGLFVTVVWLYLELLRLLSKSRRR